MAGLPEVAAAKFETAAVTTSAARAAPAAIAPMTSGAKAEYPRRLLPHQLALKPDAVRTARHESAFDEPARSGREDPIEYGVWWHETMEFMPWAGPGPARQGYLEKAVAVAAKKGFAERAAQEIGLLQAGELWGGLTSGRWNSLAELSIVAPLGDAGWVDGVIDLVAEDAATGELMVLDWKTNCRREGEEVGVLLKRLIDEYRPQLEAYGACLAQFFPQRRVRLGIYASSAGQWGSL